MEIQNISGPDLISRGLSINSQISNENVNTERNEIAQDINNPEEKKGTIIDTRA